MKNFVTCDIHGNIKALEQCLERSKFNYEEDKLIVLGDTCDGFPYVKDCFDEFLKIKNLVYVLGNHDEWTLDWMKYGDTPNIWTSQGGFNTILSYGSREEVPQSHIDLLQYAQLYHIENIYDKQYLFVHGGIDTNKPFSEQHKDDFLWDRDLLNKAYMTNKCNKDYKYGEFDKIFLGHTTTQYYRSFKPLFVCNIIALDQGAGWSGCLTIMNIDTFEYWQSDMCKELYPDIKGR